MRIYLEQVSGGIYVHFEDGEQELAFKATALHRDSLSAFAEAALSFVDWDEGRGRMDEVPLTYELVLRRERKSAIFEVFEVREYHTFVENGALVFRVEDTPNAILLAFWRALRNLESRFDPDHWNYDFPTKAVERLGSIVKG